MTTGTLYLVATPIGCVDDLGARARQVLGAVDVVAAEDTRVARALLREIGVQPPRLVSYHDHVEAQRAPALLAALEGGEDVALISDAGTPLLSDPGYRLVVAAVDAGIRTVPVPGPSALLAALVVSGLPPDRFTFLGFLPRQPGRRAAELQALVHRPETLVLYEAPHRVEATLDALLEALGDRPACLAVSLTKAWERLHRGRLSEVRASWLADPDQKGEMTLVVGGSDGEPRDADRARVQALITSLVGAGVAPGVVRDAVSDAFGLPRREVYQAALAARDPE